MNPVPLMLFVMIAGCTAEQTAAPPAAPALVAPSTEAMIPSTIESPVGRLTRVEDSSLVCMVNNQFMGKAQIPIEVEGKTYYGCCDMCKGRLARDPASRVGTDPVSGRPVDKATAVIAQTERGATLYFESEQSFAAYARSTDER